MKAFSYRDEYAHCGVCYTKHMHDDTRDAPGVGPGVKPAIADTDWVAPPTVVMGKGTPRLLRLMLESIVFIYRTG